MRSHGFAIETASVNSIRPPAGGFPATEMQEAARTYYIKQTPKLTVLSILVRTLVSRPAVMLRGLSAALKLRPWDPRGTAYALFYFVEAVLLGRWMAARGSTHLHVHFGGPVATVGMLTSIAWEIPYSLTIHGPEEFYDVGPSHLEQKMRLATFVTCISHYCRSQLLKISPVATWPKFHVCKLGVQTDVFVPAPPLATERSVHHIVCVGRLHPAKGQMILLNSFRELVRRGLPVRLSLVGDGEGRAAIEHFIERNELHQSVTLHGALSHPATRELLSSADLFVLPSFAEGVPVALMEAMSMQIACISTFVAGIPELIDSGDDGILVPPSSISELTEAMDLLLTNPARRRLIAEAGRHKVLAHYDLAKNIQRFIEVFEQHGLGGEDSDTNPREQIRPSSIQSLH